MFLNFPKPKVNSYDPAWIEDDSAPINFYNLSGILFEWRDGSDDPFLLLIRGNKNFIIDKYSPLIGTEGSSYNIQSHKLTIRCIVFGLFIKVFFKESTSFITIGRHYILATNVSDFGNDCWDAREMQFKVKKSFTYDKGIKWGILDLFQLFQINMPKPLLLIINEYLKCLVFTDDWMQLSDWFK